MTSTHKKWLSWLLKCALTVGAFTLALRQVYWADIKTSLYTQQTYYLVGALGLIILQIIFGGLRWNMLLRVFTPENNAILRTIRTYFASALFGIYMPGTIGSDLSRVWMLRAQNSSTTHIVASVLFDRLCSMMSVVLLVLLFLPHTFGYLTWNPSIALGISVTGFIATFTGLWMLRRIMPTLINSPRLTKLRKILAPMVILLERPWSIIASLCFGICAHAAFCLSIYMLALSLYIPLSATACLTLVPFVMLLTSLPISISGWGVREMGMTGALALAGVSAASAVLISVQIGLLATFVSLIGGIFYLTNKRADNRPTP